MAGHLGVGGRPTSLAVMKPGLGGLETRFGLILKTFIRHRGQRV